MGNSIHLGYRGKYVTREHFKEVLAEFPATSTGTKSKNGMGVDMSEPIIFSGLICIKAVPYDKLGDYLGDMFEDKIPYGLLQHYVNRKDMIIRKSQYEPGNPKTLPVLYIDDSGNEHHGVNEIKANKARKFAENFEGDKLNLLTDI